MPIWPRSLGLHIPLKCSCTARHDEDTAMKRPNQIVDHAGDVHRGNGGGERDSCESPGMHYRPPAVVRVSSPNVPPALSPSEEQSPGTVSGSSSSPHHFLKSLSSPPSSSPEVARTITQHQQKNREYRRSSWSLLKDGCFPATNAVVGPTTNSSSGSASFLSSTDSVADVGNVGSSSSSGRGGSGPVRRPATIHRLRRSNSDNGYTTTTAGLVSSSNDAEVRPK